MVFHVKAKVPGLNGLLPKSNRRVSPDGSGRPKTQNHGVMLWAQCPHRVFLCLSNSPSKFNKLNIDTMHQQSTSPL